MTTLITSSPQRGRKKNPPPQEAAWGADSGVRGRGGWTRAASGGGSELESWRVLRSRKGGVPFDLFIPRPSRFRPAGPRGWRGRNLAAFGASVGRRAHVVTTVWAEAGQLPTSTANLGHFPQQPNVGRNRED